MKLIWMAHDLEEADSRIMRPAWRLMLCASHSEGFGLDGSALISAALSLLRGSACSIGEQTDPSSGELSIDAWLSEGEGLPLISTVLRAFSGAFFSFF